MWNFSYLLCKVKGIQAKQTTSFNKKESYWIVLIFLFKIPEHAINLFTKGPTWENFESQVSHRGD